MHRLREVLSVRPGEGRMVVLLVGVMTFTSAGGSIGGNGIEALFFARFGVQFLPYMYVALGIITLATSLAITALLGRFSGARLYVILPLVLGAILLGERLVLALGFNWFYPLLWLGMNVMGALQGLLTWGLASAACDTRQAKRLFPLFGAGGIAGAVVGGFGTQTLVSILHAENLLLVWALALGIAFVLGGALVGHAPAGRTKRRAAPPSAVDEMRRGYDYVSQSALMRWLSIGVILFAILSFSLAFPFAKAAVAQFPNADALAGFLGAFQGISTGAAFLASLLLANRLFARLGLLPVILVTQIIYLVGFGVLAIDASFVALVAFRFLQTLWQSGIANTAYHAVYNVIPPERRDQVRAFVEGIPGQAGTVIAGLILVVGESTLQPRALFGIGLVAAILATLVVWQATRGYRLALVAALRAGQPQLFFADEEPFGGFQRDAAAVSVVVAGLTDPEPAVRRASAEILSHLEVPEATPALINTLRDLDPPTRAAALRALSRTNAASVRDVEALLDDPEPEVRLVAIETLARLTGGSGESLASIRSRLNDPDPAVRACAAFTLLRVEPYQAAEATLAELYGSNEPEARAAAIRAFADWGHRSTFDRTVAALTDASALVRRAAADAIGRIDQSRAVDPLVHALADDDRSVREAVASALGRIGLAALGPAVGALADPRRADGALDALSLLPTASVAKAIGAYAADEVARATSDDARWRAVPTPDGDDRVRLLVDSLTSRSRRHGTNALRALGVLDDPAAMALVIDSLASPNAAQKANALETIEALGERDLVRPLLSLWESTDRVASDSGRWLFDALADPDPWLRACGASVAARTSDPEVRRTLAEIAKTDADPLAREAAASALAGGPTMNTLTTLSLMERILALRRVPLFATLEPADLKRVAAIATEQLYPDGEILVEEGEDGDEMFVIVLGEVGVVSRSQPAEVEIARRRPGDYVGEMAILTRQPRVATLIARGDVRVLCLGQKEFEGLLRERPETSLTVIRVLCARLAEYQP
jgi:HEAT repeat protein